MRIALVGSALLGIACLMSLFNLRYGVLLGSVALCLSWFYFGPLAMYIPWNRLIWFITIQYHGAEQAAALFFLLAATIFTLTQRRYWSKPNSGIEGMG